MTTRGADDLGFQVESDGVYWDVIEVAFQHHRLRPNRITNDGLSHFGTRPYRYHADPKTTPSFDDWHANHSMHTPEEVQQILPAPEKVARSGRMLYISVDT